MKTALVIGGAGFVGRHLIPLLTEAEYQVDSVDPKFTHYFMRTNKPKPFVQQFPVSFHSFVGICSYDVVIHLGAHIQDIAEREKGDIEKYQDIGLDLAVMRYVAKFPPRECFIYPSSCSVDSADTDPYAYSKTVGERMAMALHKQGVPVVILRPFSGYGSDQAITYPFPAILARVMERRDPLVVWGDGNQVRDWLHIDDLARAFMWAIKDAPRGFAIDVGTGRGVSMIDLAGMMAQALSEQSGREYNPLIHGDKSKPASSPHRVARTLMASRNGFTFKVSVEEGIQRAVKEALAE